MRHREILSRADRGGQRSGHFRAPGERRPAQDRLVQLGSPAAVICSPGTDSRAPLPIDRVYRSAPAADSLVTAGTLATTLGLPGWLRGRLA
ncbi:MAG TPA: hypothetical protein VMT32_03900 [Bryobacteraceae bacterium]|nr:hypothetical protein [Bryobacteraceae bacterium]